MRCLFLAPMKAPDHPLPSGDRAMARLFVRLLGRLGYQVALASKLSTRMSDPAPELWQALEAEAEAELGRILAARPATGAPIACVFTYHLYYKAPDLIGPRLAEALGVPYVVAEATRAPRRANGPFARGHELAERAIDAADLVLIPTGASPLDLQRVWPTLEVTAHRPTAVILTMVDLRARDTLVSGAREVLDDAGVPVLNTMIGQRQHYRQAFGSSPRDLGAYPDALQEILDVA
jgi:hypothetical protein